MRKPTPISAPRVPPTPLARRLAVVALAAGVGLAGGCTSTEPDVQADGSGSDTSADTEKADAGTGSPAGPVDATTPDSSAAGDEETTTTAPTTTVAPTTTAAPTTTTAPTTTAPPEPDSWSQGDEGPEVTAIQTRLVELGYYVPAVDGKYGGLTQQAVLAFQKGAGISRDGVAGPETMAALETSTPVGPREGGDHIEIDLARQLMFVVKGDQRFVFNTSTGTTGWETPPGRFTITREIDGMRHAPLGDLWRPKYFNGGIALHGSTSIPGYPASHGCARLHNDIINMIWDRGLAPVGTPVWVY